MRQDATINDRIESAFSQSIWIAKETRASLKDEFPKFLITELDSILYDSCWPAEPWTTSASLPEAAAKVEPELRLKYPKLSDQSIGLILNYACFQWK